MVGHPTIVVSSFAPPMPAATPTIPPFRSTVEGMTVVLVPVLRVGKICKGAGNSPSRGACPAQRCAMYFWQFDCEGWGGECMRKTIIPVLVFWSCLCGGTSLADGDSVARIEESPQFIELEYQVHGQASKGSLPLYQTEGVRYFSAGVGIEERSAQYPPFSLKLVFTAGGKPFLARVAVIIQPARGGLPISIPRDHVNGPWLFVDLPSDTYHLTAVYADQTQILKGVKVETGKTKTMYLRWTEDRVIAPPSGEAVGH
jgi:hypothetical protein